MHRDLDFGFKLNLDFCLFFYLLLANCSIFDMRLTKGVCMLCCGHSPSSFISSSVVAVGEFAEQGYMRQAKLNASNYPTLSLNARYLSANNETKTPVRL